MTYNPVSTYRVQLSKNFTLNDLRDVVGYLHDLGIKTIYASPVFQAEPGSSHGYDVTSPHKINPEIGTYEDFETLQQELKKRSMGWIQDIVPNHMAYSAHNPWIADIFERGAHSSYYHYFDILWNHADPYLTGKVLLPVLGSLFEQALANQEIKLLYRNSAFVLNYYDQYFPLDVLSYNSILHVLPVNELPDKLNTLMKKMFKTLNHQDSWENLKHELHHLYEHDKNVHDYINESIAYINGNPPKLRDIMDIQVFRPAFWKASRKLINYRRFFTVNHLISLNMQNSTVFNDYHSYLFELMGKGYIQGLRVDHIDGLFEPQVYLTRLRENIGLDQYLVVEKILENHERLESSWPVQGTTGYDFLALVNNLLTDDDHEDQFDKIYDKFGISHKRPYNDLIYRKKDFILHEHMAGDLDNLHFTFNHLLQDLNTKFKSDKIKKALREFLLACPVYRIYKDGEWLTQQQEKMLKETFKRAFKRNPKLKKELNFLQELFLDPKKRYTDFRSEIDTFFNRCMQFTGPLMAKGVEDTAFYTFNRFIAHNEVGDSPSFFGLPVKDFHNEMVRKQNSWPLAMNTTSTHDTKRGEDARARLNVLSDIPDEWGKTVRKWHTMNAPFKMKHGGKKIPRTNDEYFIYQSIIGSLPMDGKPDEEFKDRLAEYLVKVLREAKMESSWAEPDEDYERHTLSFVENILNDEPKFLKSLEQFHKKLNVYGIINALNQVILKLTCPGMPDIYQGSEHWNFSFVDPDNRRPVDYPNLSETLKELQSEYVKTPSFVTALWNNATNGKIKLWLHHFLLQVRANKPDLFAKGDYIPLPVKGKYRDYIMAYARHYQHEWMVVVLPLHLAGLQQDNDGPELHKIDWKNTVIEFPDLAPAVWQNMLDKNSRAQFKKRVPVSNIFTQLPFAIYAAQQGTTDHHAGILAHITSLPGKYPSGDLGSGAYHFIDFLERSHQRYWQILPLNETVEETAFSPYSSVSAFAGNTLLIDPEKLTGQQLLTKKDLPQKLQVYNKADFVATRTIKQPLLEKAYKNFSEAGTHPLNMAFEKFCDDEQDWLDDYVLFMTLRKTFKNAPWNTWPEQYRKRDQAAMDNFRHDHAKELEKRKFFQFLFFQQWHELKAYANNKGIRLFGDIPIYLSLDSADVWAHPQYFKLDEQLKMTHVAGVPPDYFNDEGQYWGMPVFRWDELKKDGYQWWIRRLQKNLEIVDLLRLDHFRAFANYWEIPAGAKTAKEGEWKDGPGEAFFHTLQKEFPDMPFVAEDLGDVNEAVYALRDQFELPGMSVLQFGFGKDKATSVHSPENHKYNSVVYTGTHDNNTVQGWYKQEAGKKALKNLKAEAPQKIKEKNIHFTFITMVYRSAAKLAIIPIQDILGLGPEARMNIPSTEKGNWQYRISGKAINQRIEKQLAKLVKAHNRG